MGLALSGGGIRSATFNLGVVQVFAKRHLLKWLDYLSTVSGGGYIGSSVSTTLRSEDTSRGAPGYSYVQQRGQDEPVLVEHLRRSGRYLAPAIALWIAHTYALDAFDHTGYLAVVSPEKRCGKTTALQVIEALACRALSADSVSPAVVFRVIEEHGPTLVIDELDRTVGDDHEVRRFSTFGPKVLGYIRDTRCPVPGTVEDRCIRIVMRRRAREEEREKVCSRELDREAAPLRSRLARWAHDSLEALAAAAVVIPEELDDRAADTWEPLLAVAMLAGGRWPETAARLARVVAEERRDDDSDGARPGLQVLADLRELIEAGRLDVSAGLGGEEACAALRDMPGRLWAQWGRNGAGLSVTMFARLLRPFGVRPWRGSRTARRYPLAVLSDAFERYLPPSQDA